MKWQYLSGAVGSTIVIGNFAIFFSPAFRQWLENSRHDFWIFVPVFLIGFFVWGGGLAGLFAALWHVDGNWTRKDCIEIRRRLSAAVSIGGILAWLCIGLGMEPYWNHGHGSLHSLMFFTTWSFAAAVCLMQESLPLPKLPRMKFVLERCS